MLELGPPWLPFPSGVTSPWLLTQCCPVTLPGTRRAHLFGPPGPGRGRCDHSGAAKEGADRETGMEPYRTASLPLLDLASVPHPIPKCSPGRGCCQVPGTAVDFLHVPCQGYDPDAKAAFQPKAKQKGRSSTASLVKRKKKVMDQEHRVRELGARCQHAHLQPQPAPASPSQPQRPWPQQCLTALGETRREKKMLDRPRWKEKSRSYLCSGEHH